MENSRMLLTDNIKYFMEKNGMIPKDLVERSQIDKSSISKYLSNTSDPGFDKIDRIAMAFNIPVSELFVDRLREKYPTNEDRRFQSFLSKNRDAASIVKQLQRMDEWQLRTVLTIVRDLADTKFGRKGY